MKKIKAYGVCLYLKTKNSYKILLCKSIKSEHRWGFLKGVALNNETSKQTAIVMLIILVKRPLKGTRP